MAVKATIRNNSSVRADIQSESGAKANVRYGDTTPAKWKGVWDENATYAPLEKVAHLGSSYVCAKTCKGVDPEADVTLGDGVEGTYWILIAKKGDTGPQGIQGERGPQGVRGATGAQGGSILVRGVNVGDDVTTVHLIEEATGRPVEVVIPRGEEGPQGPQGVRGATGSPGKSVWVESVNRNTEFTIIELFEEYKGRPTEIRVPNGKPFEYQDFTPSQLEALRGPQGEQGEQGPSGITTPLNGFFSLYVDDNGDLWAYSEDDLSLDFEFDPETGNLYVVQEV